MSTKPSILLAEPDPAEWLGRRIGIPIDEYHRAIPGVSKSDLDNAHRSIAHYLVGKVAERKPTPAMAFGEAFHCRVLEPDRFEGTYAVAPDLDLRTKVGKLQREEWDAANKGKTIIAEPWMEQIDSMFDAVMSHPIAGRLFEAGAAEHSFFWRDSDNSLLQKCRPDYLRQDGIAVDLKTAIDASSRGFQRAVANYRYHVQAAFYADGIASVLGAPLDGFLFVAVEKEPPFAVAVYTLEDLAVEHGRLAYQDDLARIAAHVAHPTDYAGYSETIQELRLPPWAE